MSTNYQIVIIALTLSNRKKTIVKNEYKRNVILGTENSRRIFQKKKKSSETGLAGRTSSASVRFFRNFGCPPSESIRLGKIFKRPLSESVLEADKGGPHSSAFREFEPSAVRIHPFRIGQASAFARFRRYNPSVRRHSPSGVRVRRPLVGDPTTNGVDRRK